MSDRNYVFNRFNAWRENISLFPISTYDTDYVMVNEKNLEKAIFALTETGHRIEWEQNE